MVGRVGARVFHRSVNSPSGPTVPASSPARAAVRCYFGTPVVLLTTSIPDGTRSLAPMSSARALGYAVVLGLAAPARRSQISSRLGECVINLPAAELWPHVERLAPLTGRDPVPESKQAQFSYGPRKFEAAGLTAQPSTRSRPAADRRCRPAARGRSRAHHADRRRGERRERRDAGARSPRRSGDRDRGNAARFDPARRTRCSTCFGTTRDGDGCGRTFRARALSRRGVS